MSETQTLEIKIAIDAPAEVVYQAFTSSIALESWFSDIAEVDPSENGRFYAFWIAGHHGSGIFKTPEKNKRLVFTWQGRGESKETEVEISLEEYVAHFLFDR